MVVVAEATPEGGRGGSGGELGFGVEGGGFGGVCGDVIGVGFVDGFGAGGGEEALGGRVRGGCGVHAG